MSRKAGLSCGGAKDIFIETIAAKQFIILEHIVARIIYRKLNRPVLHPP
jgi:hypothetical protein